MGTRPRLLPTDRTTLNERTIMKAFSLVLAGIYFVFRNRACQAAMLVFMAWWLWGRFSAQREAEAEAAFVDAVVMERESPQGTEFAADGAAASTVANEPDVVERRASDEPLFFSPGYTEAVVSRFHQKHGRLPANWKEMKEAGIVGKIPEARPGHKIEYDPNLGMIEEVPDPSAGETKR